MCIRIKHTLKTYIFHSLSELRHLFWDMGYGFELKTANFTGVLIIVLSIVFDNLKFPNFRIKSEKT